MNRLLFTKNHRWIDLSTGMSGISYLYFNENTPSQLKFYPPSSDHSNSLGLLLMRDQHKLNEKHLKMFGGRIIDVNEKPQTRRDLIWLYRIANPKINEEEMMDFDTYMAWNHSIEN